MRQEYSPYKIIHHQDRLNDLKLRRQPNPLHLQIVPTNKCNHACKTCCYKLTNSLSNQQFNYSDHISYEKLIETLNSVEELKIKSIQITGGGEPLVYPKIHYFLEEILYRNIDLALVTNGQLLNENLCKSLSFSKWVRVSLDAAFSKTYAEFRNVDKSVFVTVLNNIRNLVKHKKNNIIGVGFVVNKYNYKEIYTAAQICKDLGVSNFRISAIFSPRGFRYFKSFLEEATELAQRTKEVLGSNSFTVFNLFNNRIKDLFEGAQNYNFCPIKELQVYLGADYNLYTCCTLAYNSKGLIGSIKNQSLYDLWNSSEKKSLYSNHNPLKVCKHPCMYQDKNIFMNYCMETNPTHVNFI